MSQNTHNTIILTNNGSMVPLLTNASQNGGKTISITSSQMVGQNVPLIQTMSKPITTYVDPIKSTRVEYVLHGGMNTCSLSSIFLLYKVVFL